jgi:hypothetical protein
MGFMRVPQNYTNTIIQFMAKKIIVKEPDTFSISGINIEIDMTSKKNLMVKLFKKISIILNGFSQHMNFKNISNNSYSILINYIWLIYIAITIYQLITPISQLRLQFLK